MQVFILTASILIMVALQLFVARTRLGKAMRATSQDRVMAGLVGININQVISITFMIGSSLAAVAGVMVTLYYGVVHFFMGYLAGHQGIHRCGARRDRQHPRRHARRVHARADRELRRKLHLERV